MKLLSEQWEENFKGFIRRRKNSNQFLATFLQYTEGTFFQVAIHFHPSHPQSKVTNTSFCALLGLLLTKRNHYFDVSIDSNMIFWPVKRTLKIGDTAPLRTPKLKEGGRAESAQLIVFNDKVGKIKTFQGPHKNFKSVYFTKLASCECNYNVQVFVPQQGI